MTPWLILPPDRAAHAPPEARGLARDEVRLLVTFRGKDRLAHATFRELPDFLEKGDLLVVNDSATLPAALTARRPSGDEIALHLSTHRYPDKWVVEPRRIAATPGERLALPAGASATLLAPYQDSQRLWLAHLDVPGDLHHYLHRYGRPIAYDYVPDRFPLSAYQTIFARVPGSAEMPSAGRPFSERVLSALNRRGVNLTTITLHTGVASLEGNERPYEEWFDVPDATALAINDARASNARIIAVGTTVVRALETWAADAAPTPGPGAELAGGPGAELAAGAGAELTGGTGAKRAQRARPPNSQLGGPGERSVPRKGRRGWTDLVITPERGVQVVHGLLTGFHEPAATHIQMLESISNPSHIRRAYRTALDHHYLWHEFGDVHLIL